jgi:hypothetical protein
MASCGVPSVVALEIATTRRSTEDTCGRPPADLRDERREPAVGAPRIHGELLKLGIDVGQTTVAKYMSKRRRPPSQGWKTFLRNHADAIVAIDMFVVPTISFRLLYGFLVLRHARRELLWLGVTTRPNAEWLARQLTEACGWNEPPGYIIRDRDGAYGDAFLRRLGAMGIRDRPISAGRHGKTGMQRGSSARSGGSVLITSSCLASDIFATGSLRIKNTTTRSGHTCRCKRMRRFGVRSAKQAASCQYQSWADSITSMFEFEFATRTRRLSRMPPAEARWRKGNSDPNGEAPFRRGNRTKDHAGASRCPAARGLHYSENHLVSQSGNLTDTVTLTFRYTARDHAGDMTLTIPAGKSAQHVHKHPRNIVVVVIVR